MTSRGKNTESAAWPGRWSIAIAVGTLAVAVTVWWFTARGPLEAASVRGAASVSAAGAASAATTSSAGPARVAPLPAPPVTPYPAGGTAGISADDPLTAYRKANVYPPTSRPLTRDQVDLLYPNQRHETTRPADHGLGVSYLFTADRYFVLGDETLTATLDVRKNGTPIAAKMLQSYAAVLDPVTRKEQPIPLTFAPSGTLLAATFTPAKLGLKRQASIGMYIEFEHAEGKQRAHFDFQYTPTSGIPARFTGVFGENLRNGSLVINAGIDVTTAGHYVVDANLFDAQDQPVVWTRFKGELAAGKQSAELLFFGKVIVDASARGPFHIGQLRGARYAPGEDPDLEQMPPFTGSYSTQPYPTSSFSDAEYDSPDKQRMIELLGEQTNHRGGAGRP